MFSNHLAALIKKIESYKVVFLLNDEQFAKIYLITLSLFFPKNISAN